MCSRFIHQLRCRCVVALAHLVFYFARWGPFPTSLRARAAASRRFPPALACGRRRRGLNRCAHDLFTNCAAAALLPLRISFFTSLGGAPSPPRCALGPPLRGGSLRPSLAAAGAGGLIDVLTT